MSKTVNAICKNTVKVKNSIEISRIHFSSWEYWVSVVAPDTLCFKGLKDKLSTNKIFSKIYEILMITAFNAKSYSRLPNVTGVKMLLLKQSCVFQRRHSEEHPEMWVRKLSHSGKIWVRVLFNLMRYKNARKFFK